MIKREYCALLEGMYIGAATIKKVCRFLKKLKIELSYYTAVLILGIYVKKMTTQILKHISHPPDHCNIIDNSQDIEAT